MLSNVPNLAFCVGYSNAPWGLRADLASNFVCRLQNYMDRHEYRTCVPACDTSALDSKPLLEPDLRIRHARGSQPAEAINHTAVVYTAKLLSRRVLDEDALHRRRHPPVRPACPTSGPHVSLGVALDKARGRCKAIDLLGMREPRFGRPACLSG
jgi:hypothetical protein